MKGLSEILKGTGGGYELNRVVGAFGGFAYVLAAIAFQAWYIHQGHLFDVTAFCLAFAGGLATITSGTAVAVAVKDRNVASSKIIEQTGAVPTPAKDGARVPVGDPPPVDDAKADEAKVGMPDYAV